MVVFELSRLPPGDGPRMASLGSCRVHGPLFALGDRGDLRYCAFTPIFFTHTAAEALQTLDLVAGGKPLADALSPYVFGTKATPPLEPFRLAMQSGLDAVFVEVSHDRQFVYGDVQLQASYLSSHFVRPRGSALLPWFRELSRSGNVDESQVQAALEALRRGEFEFDDLTVDLLRRVRLERQDPDAIETTLEAIESRINARLVVVGHIHVEDQAGAIMKDRRALNAVLRGAAAGCGATFFDPSPLVVAHGRTAALDNNGADIYEYAPNFRRVVGESLIASALGARTPGRRPSPVGDIAAKGAATWTGFAVRSVLAERLNLELVELHRSRLTEMGPDDSGLYDHYVLRLQRGSLIDLRERAVLELIDAYLPPYDAYGVMRAGLGELALLLAAAGRAVIAFEPNANRRSAIEAGLQHLRLAGLMRSGSLTLVASLTHTASALGIGLNVGLAPGDSGAPSDLEAVSGFEALLIDPEFFFRRPSDGQCWPSLEQTLEIIGFARRRKYPADGLAWFHR